MPIYEFRCKECNYVFEEFVFSSSQVSDGIICPNCGAKNVDKLMSAFSSSGGSTSSFSGDGGSCSTSGFG